jgi:triosephosphate isomerase (TIM)
MRRLLIAGNWKMNMLRADGMVLVEAVVAGAESVGPDREMLLIPPYTLLTLLAERLRGSRLHLGAQDLHWENSGAYTSGISGPMILDAGCRYVLVGHSERRDCFGDTGEVLARKVRAALAVGLEVIFCVGEHLEERERGETAAVLTRQMREVLTGLDGGQWPRVTLAYEPVWAIGTGRTATPETAQEAHAHVRREVASLAGAQIAQSVRILYGGSVKPANAGSLLARPDIDGALVGGASLDAASFLGIAGARA